MTGLPYDNRQTAHTAEHQSVPLSLEYCAECACGKVRSSGWGETGCAGSNDSEVLALNGQRNQSYSAGLMVTEADSTFPLAATWLLASVLLHAGLAKAGHPRAFASALRDEYRIT